MKGVIVPRLPRARKVPPAAVGGPSICQERRAAERNPAPVMSDTTPGREEEEEEGAGERGDGVLKQLLFNVCYKYFRETHTHILRGHRTHTHRRTAGP